MNIRGWGGVKVIYIWHFNYILFFIPSHQGIFIEISILPLFSPVLLHWLFDEVNKWQNLAWREIPILVSLFPGFFFGRFFVKKILYNVYTRRWCLLSKPKILISFVVPWACPGGSVSPLLGFFNTVSTIHRADTNSWMVTHLSDNRVVKGA